MKQLVACSMMISMILGAFGCQTEIMAKVLDDISRDMYEKSASLQRIEKMEDPTCQDPLTYDQYQMERKALVSDRQDESVNR